MTDPCLLEMWPYFGTVGPGQQLLNVPWVVFKAKHGIYRGVGPVRGNGAMAAAWIVIVVLNALLITAITRYSQKKLTPLEVFLVGAFVGVVSYSTFNATAVNIMQDWSPATALADTVWGALLYGTAACLASLAFHPWNDIAKTAGPSNI